MVVGHGYAPATTAATWTSRFNTPEPRLFVEVPPSFPRPEPHDRVCLHENLKGRSLKSPRTHGKLSGSRDTPNFPPQVLPSFIPHKNTQPTKNGPPRGGALHVPYCVHEEVHSLFLRIPRHSRDALGCADPAGKPCLRVATVGSAAPALARALAAGSRAVSTAAFEGRSSPLFASQRGGRVNRKGHARYSTVGMVRSTQYQKPNYGKKINK